MFAVMSADGLGEAARHARSVRPGAMGAEILGAVLAETAPWVLPGAAGKFEALPETVSFWAAA